MPSQKMLKPEPPIPVNVTLCRNKVCADDQVKMRAFGRDLTRYDCVHIKRGTVNTEKEIT